VSGRQPEKNQYKACAIDYFGGSVVEKYTRNVMKKKLRLNRAWVGKRPEIVLLYPEEMASSRKRE
jgi:hypothetical protein